jgi:hypothetical protein
MQCTFSRKYTPCHDADVQNTYLTDLNDRMSFEHIKENKASLKIKEVCEYKRLI